MGRSFMPKIRTERELKRVQLEGLQWTVNHVYKNSDFYRKRLEEVGVKPNHIKSLKDISKLPFTASNDLQEGYPFPLRSAPFEKIVRIHASSGTTGGGAGDIICCCGPSETMRPSRSIITRCV